MHYIKRVRGFFNVTALYNSTFTFLVTYILSARVTFTQSALSPCCTVAGYIFAMACCLSPSCCPRRRSSRGRPATKSGGRSSTGACRPSGKSAAETATPPASTVVLDAVDRLRRRLCHDDDGAGTDNGGGSVTQRRTRCRCCRHCLGEDDGQQATGTDPPLPAVHPDTSSPTPRSKAVVASGTTRATTTEVADDDADFMTLFFRSCERVVMDNAAAIHEMLSVPAAYSEEERQQNDVVDDWTSNQTVPSSSTNIVDQRRHLSDNDDNIADNLQLDTASALTDSEPRGTEDVATLASCGRTEDSAAERMIAPANSPVSAGSWSFSDDEAQLTATCVCSPSTKAAADVADDGLLLVRRRPSVSGQSPAAVNAVSSTADRSGRSQIRAEVGETEKAIGPT